MFVSLKSASCATRDSPLSVFEVCVLTLLTLMLSSHSLRSAGSDQDRLHGASVAGVNFSIQTRSPSSARYRGFDALLQVLMARELLHLHTSAHRSNTLQTTQHDLMDIYTITFTCVQFIRKKDFYVHMIRTVTVTPPWCGGRVYYYTP